MQCWICGKVGHSANTCPDAKRVNKLSVEELLKEGFRRLEGGGFVHPDYLKGEKYATHHAK